LKPKAIVIHIGTNNLAGTVNARSSSPEEIVAGITAIIEQAQSKCPGAKIILMAIFPRGKTAAEPKRAILQDINARLAAGPGQRSGVTFLDITAKWLEPDGSISKEIMPDALHPNQKGYAVWADAIKGVLPQ
jgi:lysophospholipase L1-like esterase